MLIQDMRVSLGIHRINHTKYTFFRGGKTLSNSTTEILFQRSAMAPASELLLLAAFAVSVAWASPAYFQEITTAMEEQMRGEARNVTADACILMPVL